MVAAIALALTFASSPGRISPDTKLDLTANPLRFLSRATNLWNSDLPFGQAQNQAYGYLFPHGTFFLAGHLLGLPGWVTQRLWWALLLTVGFWGLLRVAEALGIGSPTSRVVAAAAFALSPRVLTTAGVDLVGDPADHAGAVGAAADDPGAARHDPTGVRCARLAGQAGVAVALMGAVNAIATLAGCLPAVIWWACHRPNRRWWRYTAWWLLAMVLAMTWWVVALVLMARISPPFLDFIESSGVTTQWSSLVEVLRGTDSWTPFVAPNATAGAPLVTGSVAIVATCLVAAAGLAGLAMSGMPARGRLVTMLLLGVALLGVGYSGGLGSPVAQQVQAFLDAGGAPLRNVHKLESLIRIPVVLGLAQLLGRVPLPGSAPKAVWLNAFAHPERDKRVAVGIVALTALMAATSLAWTGRITPPGTFTAIPRYWHETADWLSAHNTGTPTPGRVLVVPGAPFATQLWGTSHDEPLQVLGDSPWGVRDSIPLTPPQTIRALDAVQRLFAAGTPRRGSRIRLPDRVFPIWWCATTWIRTRPGRPARSWCIGRSPARPGCRRSPSSAPRSGLSRWRGSCPTAGCVRDIPRSRSTGSTRREHRRRSLSRRHRPDAARRRWSRGAAATRRAPTADRAAGAGSGAADRGRDGRGRAGSGCPGHRYAAGTGDRLRPGRRPLVGDPGTPAIPGTPSTGCPTIRARAPTPVYGAWTGGRLTASSSSSDSTVLPDVATAASPAAAIDADSATAWVSNALQSAVGQWLQVDFDHPVTNAVITINPSPTTVGAQVRRVEIETATGTTTLRFDEAGKPVTGALPYGETPWVRITAIGTDDGSPGVQFAITDLSITQYDAKGYAHPINVRHTALVPAAPPNAAVAQWDLGTEPLGRPGCAMGPEDMQCAPSMALAPESPASFSRTLSVPAPISVVPTIWVRARSGPKLADLIAEPDTTQAHGDSDSVDVLGAAYAATDGDPATAWTAQQRVVQHKTPPTLTLTLPQPTEVTGLRLTPTSSSVPAHPTMVAVDLGDGPQAHTLKTSGPQTLSLQSRVTDTVTISLLDWKDVIDRTAVGFDQLKPPGLAEIAALATDGTPIAAADAARNRGRDITVDCEHGPIIAIAGRFVHTEVHTTVGALLDGAPVSAQPCDSEPIQLPAGAAGVGGKSRTTIRRRRRATGRSARRAINHRHPNTCAPPAHGARPVARSTSRTRKRRGCWWCPKASTPAGWRAPASEIG